MAHAQQSSPTFQTVASTTGFLTEQEMDALIAEHEASLTTGKVAAQSTNLSLRRSRIAFLPGADEKYQWLYERVWAVAMECNQRFFGVDISGIEGNIQLARYDGSEQGFYDWHMDFSGAQPRRKISISIQLSRPEDYEGGDLELVCSNQAQRCERARGAFIAFPSFVLHRVTPVTRGTRWSLVAWIYGPRWR